MERWKLYLKITINFIIFLILILFAILLLPKIIKFFLPIIIGWIVAMIANPLIKFLEQKMKIVRKLSSAVLIVITIVAVIGALYGLFSIFIKEVVELSKDIPTIVNVIYDSTGELQVILNRFLDLLPTFIKSSSTIGGLKPELVTESLTSYFTLDNASLIVKNVADGAFYFIISVLFAYFFIAERDQIIEITKKVIPASLMDYFNYIVSGFKVAVGGYFKAQIKLMLIMIVILFIGLEILQVDYSFLLAIGIAVLDILPFFGTGFILWPWALSDFLLGNYFRGVGLIIIYVLCQVIKQILQPKMVGDSIGMSPLITLFFMFIGYKLMGVFGIIIGIPIGMVILNLYRMGLFNRMIRGLKIILRDLNEFRKF